MYGRTNLNRFSRKFLGFVLLFFCLCLAVYSILLLGAEKRERGFKDIKVRENNLRTFASFEVDVRVALFFRF